MSDTALRVLHIIASLSPVHGGTTTSVLQMIAGLEAEGVACDVATSDDNGPGIRLAEDAPERRLPGRHYFAKRRDFYTYAPEMRKWLDVHASDYDLVHVHGLFSYVNGLAGRVCRRYRLPYIVTPHGMANRYGMRHKQLMKKVSFGLVERALLEGAAVVHMTSRREADDFANLRVKTPVVRIALAVAPVPLGDRWGFRERHPDIGARRVAVFMGRLNPIKNLEAAIGALALPGGADWHLLVCGDGPDDYARRLKFLAAEFGVVDRISWLGFISGQNKADVLAASDVYLQPSLSESFGMAAVEAVSAGLPCILGEDIGISDDLAAAGFAIKVPPTSQGVNEGLGRIANVINRDASFIDRARRFVVDSFSSERVGRHLSDVYVREVRRISSRTVI